ncbi:beta-1,4-N-acetylgalactosaminyltransferase bre-4-like [Ruditapes philippinarum]|uniref:beta-1,4-N-acetylgalactosaminyltransferase bre-4-like n=1 Tax=Ruditapes philippinarum TaxID=129788 RepID=UPI00295ADE52|nr:beta-1,4-N-acetylgalactosaminyltransferase bre-4-like [Ruditapes philippinarum]
MHSKRLKFFVRIVLIFSVISNVLFCLGSVYYISNCNGVVLKDMALTGTGGDQGDTPTWNNINHRNVEMLPQWSKLNISAQFPYEEIKENIDTVCPDRPPQLVGRMNISGKVKPEDVFNVTSLKMVRPGGHYIPACKQEEKVAIIVPYRDRENHLQILLYHLHTFLQKQQLHYAVFVVEMAYPTQFNRGILANIGYLTSREILNFTCYIIHDVDLLPADDRNLYRCSDNPRHLSVSSSKYGYKLPYGHYNGGVVAFTSTQFEKINGFSNAYFGWGKEDDDLHKRILKSGFKIDRPDAKIGDYEEIVRQDIQDLTNPDNPMKDSLYLWAEKRFKNDGINSVLYQRIALEFLPLYTWVYVNTSELTVMKMIKHIDPGLKEAFARVKKA